MAIRDDAAERMPRHSMSLHPSQSAKIIDEHTVNAALLLKPQAVEEFPLHTASGRTFHSNNELWEAVIRERIRATPTPIHLESFFLFEWFPRSPGLYYTPEGNFARLQAQEHIERIDKGVVVYDPYGKLSMLEGGVGSLRFRPITIRETEFYLMSASSTGTCHQGFPVALPAGLFEEKVVDEINRRGCLVTSLTGRLKFLPKNLTTLYYGYREIPQLYLEVEELRRPDHPKSRSIEELRVSVAVSFLSQYEGRSGVYAAYVYFDPSKSQSFSESVEWLEEDYVVGKYKGRILTDFDEQRGHFPDAPFSLSKIMDLSLQLKDLVALDRSTGINPTAILKRQDQIVVEVYMDAKYKFVGDNQKFGVVGDNTQIGSLSVGGTVDLAELKEELSRLRLEARKHAETSEQDMAVAEIARAEGAASGGDREGVLAHLRTAGAWVLDIAVKIGTNLAAAVIKESMGIK